MHLRSICVCMRVSLAVCSSRWQHALSALYYLVPLALGDFIKAKPVQLRPT